MTTSNAGDGNVNRGGFVPTSEMIRLTEMVFIAQTLDREAEERMTRYERTVLANGDYRMCDAMRKVFPGDDRITDPDAASLMGASELDGFVGKCLALAEQEGFVPTPPFDSVAAEAKATRLMAEKALLAEMNSVVPGLGDIKLAGAHQQAIGIVLQLLSPYVRDAQTAFTSLEQRARSGSSSAFGM